jgi:dihydroorotate dehydrogenase electron transfer subunit
MSMIQTIATLVDRQTFGPAQELILRASPLARSLAPGQAVLVKIGWGVESYLRRTFYPIRLDEESWAVRVPPGSDWGHAWLAAAPIGTALDCLGPVGSGYGLPESARNLLCLGDGEAAWTLLPAIAQAVRSSLAVTFAMEAPTGRDLIPAPRLPAAVEYHTVVRPRRPGNSTSAEGVAQFLPELLPWADVVLAAGSLAFYRELALAVRTVRYELTRGFVQALYPAAFLCGVGACQACVADLAAGRRRICLRGPVLDLADALGDER